ncbi:MAG: ADP-ribosylglycohydrolase family protein [Candidatus Omnitrophica bacterium]|nr:ADP-ribosylglycohydrolase family protein [bacterium]MBK7496883.1 ADP-ribosylglycohydrolase family protein [Candidatus Omnitrophota bacterium]MBV6481373.1 hypothetical protein [bacterium]MCC6733407.1 ADP-ribosylglycohydrolase family protein [Candidatus Omnitrophota bacterium]
MSRCISYEDYLDKTLGGWIGKSIGGTVGAFYEGDKSWIEIDPRTMFPREVPPNDDLDLQVLWLKVLEERGASLESSDLAQAWLEGCWYPFNEYGIFRRNWRLGIHPPMSGKFANQHWETGMGCPIRSEIWGYVFPGAPEIAAEFAWKDGTLDHTEQSVGAEQMFSAMAAMAFFETDIISLAHRFKHYLPEGSVIRKLVDCAFDSYAQGLSLRHARERILLTAGNPEACDSQVNVPFTILSLLHGGMDFEKTILSALACGFDTDCTLATAAAFLGQILGAKCIPESLKNPIGNDLVMGIEYRREEMTLTALARDTARMGVLLSQDCETGVAITNPPAFAPLPESARKDRPRILVHYPGLPAAKPGETVDVVLEVKGEITADVTLAIQSPEGWTISPERLKPETNKRKFALQATAPSNPEVFPLRNLFHASLQGASTAETTFGIAGASIWQILGVFYDVQNPRLPGVNWQRILNHNFASLQKHYLPEPDLDFDNLCRDFSQLLGKPALLYSYEREIDPGRLVGLRGACCVYLGRTLLCPEDMDYYVVAGHTEPFRLYINGELAGESLERIWYTPFNTFFKTRLKKGANKVLLKLLKTADDFRFSLDFRPNCGSHAHLGHHHSVDWQIELADILPTS